MFDAPDTATYGLSHAVAAKAVADLDLAAANRVLADHWLSLWRGDALPPRAAFHPARLKPFLPSMLLFQVVPDQSVTVRLAGTAFRQILGAELTGADWIASAPESYRAARLRTFSEIARGAICMAHRRIAMSVGEDYLSQEVILPFAADAGGGQPVMAHVNFKLEQFLKIKSTAQAIGDPIDLKLVPLTRPA